MAQTVAVGLVDGLARGMEAIGLGGAGVGEAALVIPLL